MRVPVKYLELVRIFKEASRNFKSTFQDIEDAKTIGAYTESWFLRPSNKLFISWHCPFHVVGGADGGGEHADAAPGGAQEGIPPHQDTLETDLWSGDQGFLLGAIL